MCDFLIGLLDVFAILLIVLPLYPNAAEGFVYSVNLFAYTQTTSWNRFLYWTMFLLLVAVGMMKLVLIKRSRQRYSRTVTGLSMLLSFSAILLLAMTRESYAVVVLFLLFVMKGLLFVNDIKL